MSPKLKALNCSKNVNKLVDALEYWTMKKSRYGNAMRMTSFSATESTQNQVSLTNH